MSFLLLPPPTETSLRISQYDPKKLKRPKKSKKRLPTADHSLSNVDPQTGAHRNLQESELRVLTDKALRLPIVESPSDAPGPKACKVISRDSVEEMTADQLMRRGIQHTPSVAGSRVFPGLHTADQHSLGAESDYAQVGSAENGASDISLPGHPDSLFGDFDFDCYLAEQEACPGFENNDSCATDQNTDTPDDQTDDLVCGEIEKSNISGSSTYGVVERRGKAKRRRSQDDSSVVIDNSDGGTSKSDVESVFENSSSKRSKSGSWGGSQGSSLYCSDNEDIATPTTRLRVCPPIPAADLAERQNDCSSAELHGTSNSVHDIDPKIGPEDPDSDDDELSHSPSWYRFRPSTATIEGTGTILEARHRYVALVEDVFRDREFHEVLGKEYIDGEVHYLVDWVPTLVRGHVLHKAKAQPLISRFEGSCEAQRKKKKHVKVKGSPGVYGWTAERRLIL